ncbi:MAG: RNA polymerase sigma factor SigX [Armatimonadetes bacterium]|nr:RNA polymerase sigma factor SigX [Armatimonadota bacterium]
MFPRFAGKSGLPSADFKQIFDLYYPAVHRRAAYILGSPEAAEDVAQETFLKLYQAPPQERANLAGWLLRVATNLAYNHLRSEKNRLRRESSRFLAELAAASPSVEESCLQSEEMRLVQAVLQRLAPRDRVGLLLKYSGAGYREIAAALDLKPGSVGTVLARALARFRQEYERLSGGG